MIVTHPARGFARLAVLVSALSSFSPAAQAQGEVNIYSYREPQLIDPLLKAFTDKTGIKANVVYAAAGLNERLAAEGQNSPADLLFTVDAGRLSEAKDAGLTQPIDSSALKLPHYVARRAKGAVVVDRRQEQRYRQAAQCDRQRGDEDQLHQ